MHSETINVANLGIVIKGVTDAAGAVERAHAHRKSQWSQVLTVRCLFTKMVMKNPAEQKLEELFGPGSEKKKVKPRIEGVAEVNDALLAKRPLIISSAQGQRYQWKTKRWDH